jgi:hypothetical protein
MTFYHWDPITGHYVDKLNRIVVLDGVDRGAPNPYLRRLRELEVEVVRQSQRVQKMLDLCGHYRKEATGNPGKYSSNTAGTRFLDRDTRETCIKTLIEYNKDVISKLECIYNDLEKEKDMWAAESGAKNDAHYVAQARQAAERIDWEESRRNRDPKNVRFFWK